MQHKIIPDIVDGQTLFEIAEDSSVRQAAAMMAECKIAALLVTDNGHLRGIITERDMTQRLVARGLDAEKTTVGDIMTRNPDTLGPEDTALNALQLMKVRRYRHLPVVNGDKVVGMVSIRDLYEVVHQDLEHGLRETEAFIFGDRYGA